VLQKFLVNALLLDPEQILELSASELCTFKALSDKLSEHAGSKKAKLGNAHPNSSKLMLFLDEVHHDAALDLRSGLLRLMETGIDKFLLKNGKHLPYKKILYVLAASKTVEELRMKPPPDLWTRIDHTVVQHHPLRLANGEENRKEAIKDYFFRFWMDRCKIKHLYPNKKLVSCKVKLVCCEDFVDKLSQRFADQISSPFIPVVSIRILRNIILRLRSKTEYYVRTHPSLEKKEVACIVSIIGPEFDRWMLDIFNELVPSLNHSGMF
jgi:hypothetical protein